MYHSILSIGKYRTIMPFSSYMHNDARKLAIGPKLERDCWLRRCSVLTRLGYAWGVGQDDNYKTHQSITPGAAVGLLAI